MAIAATDPAGRASLHRCCLAAALLWLSPAGAATVLPHLNAAGQADYRAYLDAREHRAFAIAPGGAWGWKAEAGAREEAEEAALAACQANTRQKCVLYGVVGKPVFDARKWTELWGPYADAAAARQAPVGRQVGQRFHDLAYADADGRRHTVSGLRGKVVVLHFWGSWCGPCRREMPELQRLYASLKDRRDIAFALLQVREKFAVSQQWAQTQALRLPLYDSGSTGDTDAALRLADGGKLGDREIAASFPSTYVLDKRGIVVFSHAGPVHDWSQYRDFLLDAVLRSGR